jgi:antitoxin component YwqK of YwqJK toxin-antitoxin module
MYAKGTLCLLVIACSGCADTTEPTKIVDQVDWGNTIPKEAEAREGPPQKSDCAWEVRYVLNDNLVGIRRYWDTKKTRPHSEELFTGNSPFDCRRGIQREWYKNGQLRREEPYKDGLKHGTFKEWYDNGQLASERPYKEDLLHGTVKQWDEKGILLGSFVFEEGTGAVTAWLFPDKRRSHTEHKNGKLHGEARSYHANGQLSEVETYQNGSQHGIRYFWNEDGKQARESPEFFLQGSRVTKEEYLRAAETNESLPPLEAQEEILKKHEGKR